MNSDVPIIVATQKSTSDSDTDIEAETNEPDVVIKYKKLIADVDKGDKLGDEHINAANQLLRSQFPDIRTRIAITFTWTEILFY